MNEDKITSEKTNYPSYQANLGKENETNKNRSNFLIKNGSSTFFSVLSTWFPIKRTFQVLIVLLVSILFVSISYVIILNLAALQYNPENVVKKFTSLIENPTQTVTDEEKKVLSDITQAGFLSSWGNENNIKTLRTFAGSKAVEIGNIEYSGPSKKYATIVLKFQNNYTNPESKQAKLYLEQYPSNNFFGIIDTAYRWRIYQIDMPRTNNVLDNITQAVTDTTKNIDDGTKNFWDSLTGLFK
jgi:hypothetical protein